jgi:hypothetical protein
MICTLDVFHNYRMDDFCSLCNIAETKHCLQQAVLRHTAVQWYYLHSVSYQNLLLSEAFGFKMQHERKAAGTL